MIQLLKIILTAAFGLLFVFSNAQQKEDFSKIFSKDYEKAARFLEGQKWMDELILSYGLKPKEVKAIIFPELIRYNAIQDKIETFALESLYIQYGKSYADFSVSEFQIKPSFAERVEIDFIKLFPDSKIVGWHSSSNDTIQTQASRSNRLTRIKDPKMMTRYICLFLKVITAKYPLEQDEERIKLYSSAYNCGYWKSREEIRAFQSKKFFHTGLSIASKKYCYAEVAWYFFNR
ncbi:hypothetical protein WSM22_16330 [Cytophagales bacterium WSM2-2]|nr:hypothetical protein WSM22_16330 [Cytophagales bacterium WSM2-2]